MIRYRQGTAWGRGRTAAAILLLVLVALTPPALAQPQGEDPDDERAPADTSLAEQMMKVLRPSYTSTYSVMRKTTTWDQDFVFGSGFDFMGFNNKTSFKVRGDSDRDEDRRDGRNTTDLRWFVIPGAPIHMQMNMGRRSAVRPGIENTDDETGLSLDTQFRRDFLGIRHNLSAGGSLDRRTSFSLSGDRRSKSTDSGFSGDLSWRMNWKPIDAVTANATLRERRAEKTITLESTEEAIQEQPSSSQNRTVDAKVGYEPADWLSSNVSFNSLTANDESFDVRGGTGYLEERINTRTALVANFLLKPFTETELSWRVAVDAHDLDYRVRVESASAGNGDSWEGKLKTRVWGANIDVKLLHTFTRLEPAISDTTETKGSTFEGKISRRISEKFTAQLDLMMRANQVFFLVEEVDDRLDHDELRTKFQPSLTYTPGNKWTVTMSYLRNTIRRVNLRPSQAGQTSEDQDFTVNVSIGYRLSQITQISQSYSIKALYTTFDYTPTSDRLLSTQRIVTGVDTKITPKVNLRFEHRFTLQDSGPFRFRKDGSREFARNLRKYRQEASSGIGYQVAPWLELRLDSRFLRIDDRDEISGTTRTNRSLTLNEGFSLKHLLRGGVMISATGGYVRSSAQPSYWTLQASVDKDF